MPEWIWHWSGYAVALVALVGVAWALFADRSRGRGRCRRCWYDLSGVRGGAADLPADCPECGKAHSKPRHLTRTRRRWGRAFALLLLMVVGGYGLWVVPRVQDEGAWGLAPTRMLFLASPWLGDAIFDLVTASGGRVINGDRLTSVVLDRADQVDPVTAWASWHWLRLVDGELSARDARSISSHLRMELLTGRRLPGGLTTRASIRLVDDLIRTHSCVQMVAWSQGVFPMDYMLSGVDPAWYRFVVRPVELLPDGMILSFETSRGATKFVDFISGPMHGPDFPQDIRGKPRYSEGVPPDVLVCHIVDIERGALAEWVVVYPPGSVDRAEAFMHGFETGTSTGAFEELGVLNGERPVLVEFERVTTR